MQGFKDKVIEYIDRVHVSCCLQSLLLKKGKCTHDGLINTLKIIIRWEVRCAEVCSLQHWITLSFPMATCSERLYSRGTCVDRNVRKCKWNELACHKIAFVCWNNVKKIFVSSPGHCRWYKFDEDWIAMKSKHIYRLNIYCTYMYIFLHMLKYCKTFVNFRTTYFQKETGYN